MLRLYLYRERADFSERAIVIRFAVFRELGTRGDRSHQAPKTLCFQLSQSVPLSPAEFGKGAGRAEVEKDLTKEKAVLLSAGCGIYAEIGSKHDMERYAER